MNGAIKVFVFIAVIVGMAVLFALPVMWLWNDLMPALFGLGTVTLWQALEMGVLASLLFKSSK